LANEFDVENPDKEELKRIYNDRNRYNWTFDLLDGYKDSEDLYRMQAILNIIEEHKPFTVLDNGCGAAVISRAIAHQGIKVVGFDLSEELLKKIQPTENLVLVTGDADKLPFEKSTFDCIICSEVLEHIIDYKPAIKEMVRVLNEDGIVIITVPNLFCYDSVEGNFGIISKPITAVNLFLKLIGRRPVYQYGHNMHFHKMFPWQWRRVFESHGLKVEKEQAVFISPYIPNKLKVIERLFYSIPGMFRFKAWFDEQLCRIWPFKYLGQNHLFICRKK